MRTGTMLLATVWLLAAAAPAAELRLTVKARTETASGNNRVRVGEQSYALDVTARNATARVLEGLVLHYWYIGEDLRSGKTVLAGDGEVPVPRIGVGEERFFETPPVRTAYFEGHRRRRAIGAGVRIDDYVVRVMEGDRVIDETASRRSLIKQLDDLKKPDAPARLGIR